mmetsp:Transcript_28669/g.66736  ORF Transcript_28669/g.66736 Transcript_28669/m.66736 type:complete len:1457 (-) Transcript_28669:690-5060(-)
MADMEATASPEQPRDSVLRVWADAPVAPAVVVQEVVAEAAVAQQHSPPTAAAAAVQDSDQTYQQQYPVATFVGGFVNGSEANTLQSAGPPGVHTHTQPVLPLAVQSEIEANSFGLNAIVANALPPQQHHAVAARSMNDHHVNDEAQFMLVDGNLVEIQPSQSSVGGLDVNNGPAQSQPPKKNRLHRGVRKIGKMFGAIKKKPLNHNQRASSIESAASVNEIPTIDPESEHATRQSSVGESSTPSPSRSRSPKTSQQQQRRRHRGSWRQRANSRDQVGRNEEVRMHPGRQRADTDPNVIARDEGQAGMMGVLSPAEPMDQLHSFASVPAMVPIHETSAGAGRIESATATRVGTENEVCEQTGILPAAASAEVFLEYEFYNYDDKEKKDDIPASLVPVDADLKVDKADAPDVESMLMRAAHETTTDLEKVEFDSPKPKSKGKSDGLSVPLTQAKRTDKFVHNDILKVILVGSVGNEKSTLARAIRGSTKRPKKRTTLGLDVHNWLASGMNFQLWDVQGATTPPGWSSDSVPNFGAHPATQSLFFSGESLYLLVWDLACNNPHTHPMTDYDSDSDNGYADAWARDQAIAEADRALCEDISDRVLAWVDRIAQRSPRSAVLPVAVIPDGMEEIEVARRCSKMFEMLENHMKWYQGNDANSKMPNIILDDSRNLLSVNYSKNFGIRQIQDTIVAIAQSGSVFPHVGSAVPPGTVQVLEYSKRVRQDHKMVRLDHILGELSNQLTVEEIVTALKFLSDVGEVLYFGDGGETLSNFVILSRQWLVSALSCILRNDLKREIADARKFMTMQCMYGHVHFQENEIIKALTSGATSDLPLLSDEDAKMLWQSMSFMREAADRYNQLNEVGASAHSMFNFLLALLVHFNLFLPFGNTSQRGAAGLTKDSNVFFVPPLLSLSDPNDIWSFRSVEVWTTTLCHSWLFRDGAPPELFEQIAVSLLKDVYHFSQEFSLSVPQDKPSRAHTTPLRLESRSEFVELHDSQSIGPVRIHHIICWKSAILLKIGALFLDKDSGELLESFVEIFVTIVDQNSAHCVASDAMRGSMQRVVVSGKGPSSLNGLKLYKGGYKAVLESVQSSLESFNNVNMQIICPECLARGNPRRASTWSWDEVLVAAEERAQSAIVCRRGHRVKSSLLCGTCVDEGKTSPPEAGPSKSVLELMESVVLVGVWDPKAKQIESIGSGFIADKKLGLIVTAGHVSVAVLNQAINSQEQITQAITSILKVVFNMEERSGQFGTPYCGIQDAKLAIGVIPHKGKNTVWRFFAEILADDVRNNVDACVLRITTRTESDVDEDSPDPNMPEKLLDPSSMKSQNFTRLKLETNFELEQWLKILGFSQGRSADIVSGYIVRMFSADLSDDESSSSESEHESRHTFSPREEIVVRCPIIVGHSGGPCLNTEGGVVGILSRSDPLDPHRCFLVPAAQLRSLLKRAKGLCSRPNYALKSI